MADFHEIRIDDDIAYGAVGGPMFDTVVTVLASWATRTNINWVTPLREWDLGYGIISQLRLNILIAFFIARSGRAYGFRFKDHQDWQLITQPLKAIIAQPLKAQLVRVYYSGVTQSREIKKPVSNTIQVRLNGVLQSVTVDYTTGIITLASNFPSNITGITQANPGVVTAPSHGFSTGQLIWITGVSGMTQVDENVYPITVISPNSFSIGVDTTNYGAYAPGAFGSGGYAMPYLSTTQGLIADGEFDVPVQFTTDKLAASLEAYANAAKKGAYGVQSVPIREIRV